MDNLVYLMSTYNYLIYTNEVYFDLKQYKKTWMKWACFYIAIPDWIHSKIGNGKLSQPDVTKIKSLNSLSNDIFKTILPKLENGVFSLTILRHGILNYIPFEVLYDSEKVKYLVEDLFGHARDDQR